MKILFLNVFIFKLRTVLTKVITKTVHNIFARKPLHDFLTKTSVKKHKIATYFSPTKEIHIAAFLIIDKNPLSQKIIYSLYSLKIVHV